MMKLFQNHSTMSNQPTTHSSNEIEELKRVKEEFELEIVSSSGLSTLRLEFLRDAIALLNLTLVHVDQEFNHKSIY